MSLRAWSAGLAAVVCFAVTASAEEAKTVPTLSQEQMQLFLQKAKIIKTRDASKGVTGSKRVTLSDGTLTHDAHVQCIDESKAEFKTDRGVELNFRDSYKYNIAAYRLDHMLGLNMVPMSVERKVGGKTCAITWWVDDVLMDESQRHAKHVDAPDPEDWNRQMYAVRVFDQLIYNVDRNLQNLLVKKGWQLEMIDHSRSFRLHHKLKSEKDLVKVDKALLQHLRDLKEEDLMEQLRPYLTKSEVQAVVARRDLIVKYFDDAVKEKGESAVVYELKKAATVAQGN